MDYRNSRRTFLKNTVTAGIGSMMAVNQNLEKVSNHSNANPKEKSLTFLFQGDSITDGNRGRNTDPNHIMGHGYAFSIASRVGADFASSSHQFYNRGVSGNRVSDLEARWQKDAIDVKPDVLSILIGINDAVRMVDTRMYADKDVDVFEQSYRNILTQSRNANKNILFALGIPFIYPVGTRKDNWTTSNEVVQKLAARINKLVKEFDAIRIDYPSTFEKGFRKAGMEYWVWDGIHPTVPGHELMTREWISKMSAKIPFLKGYGC